MESIKEHRAELSLKNKPFFRDTLLQVSAEHGVKFYVLVETFKNFFPEIFHYFTTTLEMNQNFPHVPWVPLCTKILLFKKRKVSICMGNEYR